MNRVKQRCLITVPVSISVSGIYFALTKDFNLKLWDIKSIEIKYSANDKMVKKVGKRKHDEWLQALKIKWITVNM